MKRMGPFLTRKGLLRKLTVFVSEYAQQLGSSDSARSGWIAVMGVNCFMEALLGLQPMGLLRESLEFFLMNLPEEVEEEVSEEIRVLVEALIMKVPPEQLETIIGQAQQKRKKVQFLGSPVLEKMKSNQPSRKKMTPDEIINSDLPTIEKEKLLIQHMEDLNETQESGDQEAQEGTQEEDL